MNNEMWVSSFKSWCLESYAPGKIILSGEHSVVYGKPALSFSIDKYTKMVLVVNALEKNSNLFLKIFLKDVNNQIQIEKNEILNFYKIYSKEKGDANIKFLFMSMILDIFNELGYDENQFELFVNKYIFDCEISSSITIGFGLGSSAAFNVCLVNGFSYAICKLSNHEFLSKPKICLISNKAEKFFHTNPSGIDVVTSVNGGGIFFKEIENYSVSKNLDFFEKNDLKMLLVSTGVKRNCKEFTGKVSEFKIKNPKLFEDYIYKIGDITNEIINIVQNKNNNVDQFFDLIIENQLMLKNINVSNEKIDSIINILKQNNICGKITGAGGGGYILVIIKEKDYNKFINISTENKFNVLNFNLENKGSFIKEKI